MDSNTKEITLKTSNMGLVKHITVTEMFMKDSITMVRKKAKESSHCKAF